jgi:hypothetical protein
MNVHVSEAQELMQSRAETFYQSAWCFRLLDCLHADSTETTRLRDDV